MKIQNKKRAFSIIEVLIGIFIFTLGIVSVFALISSTMRLNSYNEDYIIATNLAREQIELVKNIRDNNYANIKPYNLKNPDGTTFSNSDKFEISKYYKIENDYSSSATYPIKIEEISLFGEGESDLNGKMQNYRLCLDSKNRYTYSENISMYDCSSGNKETQFYRYIYIDKVEYMSGSTIETIDNAFLLKSKVIWYKKGYHEFEVKSVIADWKRL